MLAPGFMNILSSCPKIPRLHAHFRLYEFGLSFVSLSPSLYFLVGYAVILGGRIRGHIIQVADQARDAFTNIENRYKVTCLKA